jgi:hypothetical protein
MGEHLLVQVELELGHGSHCTVSLIPASRHPGPDTLIHSGSGNLRPRRADLPEQRFSRVERL